MKKQVLFFALLTFISLGFTQKESAAPLNQSARLKQQAQTQHNVTVSLASNTWGGNYLSVTFEKAGSQPVTWYPTKDIYGNYDTFTIPSGTYNHIYFQTEPGEAGPYYMAIQYNSTSYPCFEVSGEWVDVNNVDIDGSWVTFNIGDYCQSN